ncbi:hypothetical protein C2E23DRAFT_549614 [Lenzites betulinus]|nr:hypothetical protein C2E23DRAFT_549614 [Lenzites betulinus]
MSTQITVWHKEDEVPVTRTVGEEHCAGSIYLWNIEWLVETLQGMPFDLLDVWEVREARWRMVTFREGQVDVGGPPRVFLIRPLGVRRCKNFGVHLVDLYKSLTVGFGDTTATTEYLHISGQDRERIRVVFWYSEQARGTAFEIKMPSSRSICLAKFADDCELNNAVDSRAVRAWRTHFDDVGAVNLWDSSACEWGFVNAASYLPLSENGRTLLVKKLEVGLTQGLGEELAAIEDNTSPNVLSNCERRSEPADALPNPDARLARMPEPSESSVALAPRPSEEVASLPDAIPSVLADDAHPSATTTCTNDPIDFGEIYRGLDSSLHRSMVAVSEGDEEGKFGSTTAAASDDLDASELPALNAVTREAESVAGTYTSPELGEQRLQEKTPCAPLGDADNVNSLDTVGELVDDAEQSEDIAARSEEEAGELRSVREINLPGPSAVTGDGEASKSDETNRNAKNVDHDAMTPKRAREEDESDGVPSLRDDKRPRTQGPTDIENSVPTGASEEGEPGATHDLDLVSEALVVHHDVVVADDTQAGPPEPGEADVVVDGVGANMEADDGPIVGQGEESISEMDYDSDDATAVAEEEYGEQAANVANRAARRAAARAARYAAREAAAASLRVFLVRTQSREYYDLTMGDTASDPIEVPASDPIDAPSP